MTHRNLLIPVAITGLVLLAACGPKKSPPAPAPAPPIGSTEPAPATTAPSSAALPPGFPTDVPLYPGSEVTGGSAEGASQSLQFSTADAPDKVVAWYEAELTKTGWATTLEVPADGGKTAFLRKENRTLNVKASNDSTPGARTSVSLIVAEDNPAGATAAPPV